MKKMLVALVIVVMCLVGSVCASDFVIVDVFNNKGASYLALTKDGTVFQTNKSDSVKKTVVRTDVAAFTNEEGVYLLKNGNIDFAGKEISGLDVQEIIGVNMYTNYRGEQDVLYADMENNLELYSVNTQSTKTVFEDFKDIDYTRKTGVLLRNTKNELYCWSIPLTNGTFGDYELDKSNVKYIAADVVDFKSNGSKAYYLRANGELYKYDFEKFQSNLVMRNVDVQQGIEIHSSAALVCSGNKFYLNGKYGTSGRLVSFFESDAWTSYECEQGIKDVAIYRHAIYYIGSDNLLYCYNLYDYYEPGRISVKEVSHNVSFEQIYTPGGVGSEGLYALTTDNSLYKVYSATTTEAARLVNAVPNAVPKKFSYFNGMMILSEAGACYYSGVVVKENMHQMCFNSKDINLVVNGQKIELESPIQIKNGRSMYPLRECFNAMGASVIWDQENQLAIGELPGKRIEFPIGKKEYFINSVKYEMDVPSYIDASIGRTYIPIRYAAEGLGFTVNWVEGDVENTIAIFK